MGRFYTYDQNNSGGYYVEDNKYGICEIVIIEANSVGEANDKLSEIGDNVSGFNNFCSCCGQRWYYLDEDDLGTENPEIFGVSVEDYEGSFFNKRAFVHYLDGSFKEFIFKNK